MKSGDYYIGDFAWILGFEDLEFVKNTKNGEIAKFNDGSEFCKFEVIIGDYKDNCGFSYSVKSEIFGIIPAKFVDENYLSAQMLTLKNSVICNKFSGYPIAKVVSFDEDFEVKKDENLIKFANIILDLDE